MALSIAIDADEMSEEPSGESVDWKCWMMVKKLKTERASIGTDALIILNSEPIRFNVPRSLSNRKRGAA